MLTPEEFAKAKSLAAEHNVTVSDLFRSTLKCRLPKQIPKISGQTYWELTKVSHDLNQLAGMATTREPINVNSHLLEYLQDVVAEVRRELSGIKKQSIQ